jgi:hypothetical protein
MAIGPLNGQKLLLPRNRTYLASSILHISRYLEGYRDDARRANEKAAAENAQTPGLWADYKRRHNNISG